jgi:hypothetical protein
VTRVSQGLDRVEVVFDDPNLVANAGLLLVATLTQRLGLEAMVDSMVKLAGRVGGARPGRKVLTLVHAMIAGASHIDHADILRAGSTASVLGHRVMTPSRSGPAHPSPRADNRPPHPANPATPLHKPRRHADTHIGPYPPPKSGSRRDDDRPNLIGGSRLRQPVELPDEGPGAPSADRHGDEPSQLPRSPR